jgi:hypothetical protein
MKSINHLEHKGGTRLKTAREQDPGSDSDAVPRSGSRTAGLQDHKTIRPQDRKTILNK